MFAVNCLILQVCHAFHVLAERMLTATAACSAQGDAPHGLRHAYERAVQVPCNPEQVDV